MSLSAISPLDGRYHGSTLELAGYFSEFALIKSRARIELKYLLALDEANLFPRLHKSQRNRVKDFLRNFPQSYAVRVKEIEKTVNHDVKALEYFLRDALRLRNPNMIHFGLTSEDVNNLAYSSIFQEFKVSCLLPVLRRLVLDLCNIAELWQDCPFPTRTHGQLASPSTAGKEIAVFVGRLAKLYNRIIRAVFSGKLNGATGNYSAMLAAFPDYDWLGFSRRFVEDFGFDFNLATTQIEDHDSWAEFFNLVRQVNNVVIDLNQDFWNYLALGLFNETAPAEEVGSSTMPHKINPVRFENSEGNLHVANSILIMLSEKLTRSRMQRDLSDSTVTRNVGTALSHSYLGIRQTIAGLKRINLNQAVCLETLRGSEFLLAEPIQTILRTETCDDPYQWLKELSRGKAITRKSLEAFIDRLQVPPEIKQRLKNQKVEQYVGIAGKICRETLQMARRDVE